MNIIFPPDPQANWYARTVTFINNIYNVDAVAVHALTTRWTYTVPASTNAFVLSALATIMRATAGDLGAYARATISVNNLPAAALIVARAGLGAGATGEKDNSAGSAGLFMLAADTLVATTNDPSLVGTAHYLLTSKIAEFAS